MKNAALLPLLFLFSFCGGSKSKQPQELIVESPCPPEGNCAVEIMKDKSLIVKNNMGTKFYYQLADTPGRIVVRYTYTKKSNPEYQDDFYIEEVIFETDGQLETLANAQPEDIKMLFGVKCYCKGKAGYYNVNKGVVAYADKKLTIKLPDNLIDNQITKDITISVK
jgi:hypothetical protein